MRVGRLRAGPRTRACAIIRRAVLVARARPVCVRSSVARPSSVDRCRADRLGYRCRPSRRTAGVGCRDGRAGGQAPGQRGVHIGGRVAEDACLFRDLGLVGGHQERGGHGRRSAENQPLRHRHRRRPARKRRRGEKGRADRKRRTGRQAAAAAVRRQPRISSAAVSVVVRVRRPFLRQDQGKTARFKTHCFPRPQLLHVFRTPDNQSSRSRDAAAKERKAFQTSFRSARTYEITRVDRKKRLQAAAFENQIWWRHLVTPEWRQMALLAI